MKSIIQHFSTGQTELADLPAPQHRPGHLLIRSATSLISAGTERMLVEFGKAGLIAKARQQPEKVRQVLDKVRTDGLLTTIDAVRSKLAQPIQLGYCNAGVVVESGVAGFAPGDRVVSNGPHAEVVCVPGNLCARIPEGVDDESACFTVLGAIGLQGMRLLNPTLGESVAVIGAGLIGLITIQLLRAQGCRVLAIDFDERKLALAAQFGAETCNPGQGADAVAAGLSCSRGPGVDGVLITASTSSNDPVTQAAQMCRQRGRIVLVGVVGLELNRNDFYKKELSFQVSCSYGPGRYDPQYEDQGHDYPIGFVRWTEQRNFVAILDLMASGALDMKQLITHRFALEQAAEAYAVVGGSEPSIGIVLQYPAASETTETQHARQVQVNPAPSTTVTAPRVGFIGSGNYATMVLIPAFQAAGAGLHTVVSNGGLSSVHAARKFGFQTAATGSDSVIDQEAIQAVVIATRHNSHAALTCRALRAGKAVFVEKPLALSHGELDDIVAARDAASAAGHVGQVMVGFNRRFAPQVVQMKQLLSRVSGPKSLLMTVNAGAIPADHWTQDPTIGGGRIVGEACHFIDLLRHLVGEAIVDHQVTVLDAATRDSVSISLRFADGSIGTVHYLATGSKAFPKERLEVFAGGGVLQLDNFRRLRGFGWKGFKKNNLWRQDKGQRACAAAFMDVVRSGKPSPIPWDELLEISRVTIDIAAQVRGG